MCHVCNILCVEGGWAHGQNPKVLGLVPERSLWSLLVRRPQPCPATQTPRRQAGRDSQGFHLLLAPRVHLLVPWHPAWKIKGEGDTSRATLSSSPRRHVWGRLACQNQLVQTESISSRVHRCRNHIPRPSAGIWHSILTSPGTGQLSHGRPAAVLGPEPRQVAATGTLQRTWTCAHERAS